MIAFHGLEDWVTIRATVRGDMGYLQQAKRASRKRERGGGTAICKAKAQREREREKGRQTAVLLTSKDEADEEGVEEKEQWQTPEKTDKVDLLISAS